MAWLGMAWRGKEEARRGMALRGEAGFGEEVVWLGAAGRGMALRVTARRGEGEAWLG